MNWGNGEIFRANDDVKLTQAEIILKHLRYAGDWIPEYSLTKHQTVYGWLGSSADRTARRLAEKGLIERKMVGKYCFVRIAKEKGESDDN